jgi:hypothetical protein
MESEAVIDDREEIKIEKREREKNGHSLKTWSLEDG